MLPALKTGRLSLADVFPSCLAAIRGEENSLGLPPVRTAIVLLADGLGTAALKARAGHARTLMASLLGSSTTSIDSGFPTTTASALATLTTGVRPGQHGMVGYSVLDPATDRIVHQLSGWDESIDPLTWQSMPTVFEQARDAGFRATAIGPERYTDTPFTRAVLRGARYAPAASIPDRLAAAAALAAAAGAAHLVYVYVPELDTAAHAHGAGSDEWTHALETLDSAVRSLVLPKDAGLILTADHGVVDIPQRSHISYDAVPELMAGIAHVGGEPRCLQLYFARDADREATTLAWRDSEGDRSWVVTRDEAIAAGWFGEVRSDVLSRIGDLIVAARKGIAYYGSKDSPRSRQMIGQHGSWSAAELQVPLLRFGDFAR